MSRASSNIQFILDTKEEDFSIYEAGSTQRRIGPYHGVRYIATPRAFVRHRWTFRDNLGLLGCDILEVLFSYLGDEGLFPSYQTIADNLGITSDPIYKEIKRLTNEILSCPMCDYKQLILKKKTRKKGKEFISCEYNLQPILDFIQHVDEVHYAKENEKYMEALDKYKKSRKKSQF